MSRVLPILFCWLPYSFPMSTYTTQVLVHTKISPKLRIFQMWAELLTSVLTQCLHLTISYPLLCLDQTSVRFLPTRRAPHF